MTTVRHVDRLWTGRVWGKLLSELLSNRPEASPRLEVELHSLVATAALAMIRLDELNQTHTPLFSKLVRTVLASQDRDGGWRDAATTALCLRALLIDGGHGVAVDAGLRYLALLQRDDGAWPKEPLRRMPSDGFTTALLLFELGGCGEFRNSVRCDEAAGWLDRHAAESDADTKRLWGLACPRCRAGRHGYAHSPQLWPRQCA